MFRLYCFLSGLVYTAAGVGAIVVAVQANIHGAGAWAVGGCAGVTVAVGLERVFEGIIGEKLP